MCRVDINNVFSDNNLERLIRNQQVKCPNDDKCAWQGLILQLNNHFDTACPYELINCPNGCGLKNRPRVEVLGDHKDECPQSVVPCDHCEKLIRPKAMESHFRVCDRYPVLCPIGCGEVLLRGAVVEHKSVCEHRIVQCEICQMNVGLHEMEEHMKNTAAHVQTLLNTVKGLEAQLEEYKKANVGLSPRGFLKQTIPTVPAVTPQTSRFVVLFSNIRANVDQRKGEVIYPAITFNDYSLQLRLHFEQSHMLLYLRGVTGRRDLFLPWPFAATFTIRVLNQTQDSNHYKLQEYSTSPHPDSWSKPPKGNGCAFKLRYETVTSDEFFQSDSLAFEVIIKLNKPWLF